MAMAACSWRPFPPSSMRRPRMIRRLCVVAMLSTLPRPTRQGCSISTASASWGCISLARLCNNLLPFQKADEIKVEADLTGCAILGTVRSEPRIITTPVKGVMASLQDEGDPGQIVNLVVTNFAAESEARLWFPKGAKLRIVEPRVLMIKGKLFMCVVGNPASIEVMSVDLLSECERSGSAFWAAAAAAFSRGEFLRAAHYYRQSVELGFPEVVSAYSCSSSAWLKLGCFEKAFVDASKALAVDPSHFQSLFVKAQALHRMKEYLKAVECFQEAASAASNPQDKLRAEQERDRCARLNQQSSTGVFDLTKYLLGGRVQGSAPEYGDFIGPVKLDAVQGKGRGLFATRNLKAGELIFTTNSIVMAEKPGEEFTSKLFRACMADRRSVTQVAALFDESRELFDLDLFRPNIDWFSRYTDHTAPCSSYNSWIPQLGPRTGIAPFATMMNHSCLPNVSRRNLGPALFVRAARHIREGEELVISYVDPLQPLSRRKELLNQRHFDFVCCCPRCLFEEQIDSRNPGISRRYNSAVEERNPDNAARAFRELVTISQELDAMATNNCRGRQWLMTSYSQAYWIAAYENQNPVIRELKMEEAMIGIHETAPGDERSLKNMVHLLRCGTPEKLFTDRRMKVLREEAVSCFGEQSNPVLDSVVMIQDVPKEHAMSF